jgi:hypothetical protein
MMAQAEARTAERNVSYVEAYADQTGLPSGGADLVTCSQSAFREMLRRIAGTHRERGMPVRGWRKARHLERWEASGRFRFVREILLHGVEEGDAARLIGTAYSLGPLTVLLADGVGEDELGLGALKDTARRVMGDRPWPWLIGYRVRLGVK